MKRNCLLHKIIDEALKNITNLLLVKINNGERFGYRQKISTYQGTTQFIVNQMLLSNGMKIIATNCCLLQK